MSTSFTHINSKQPAYTLYRRMQSYTNSYKTYKIIALQMVQNLALIGTG